MKKLKRKWILMALPFFAGFLLFYVIPFGHSFYYSLIESAFVHTFVGFSNYARVAANPYYRLALGNTARLIVLAVPALVLLALLLSLVMFYANGRFRFMRAALLLPLLLPSAAIVPGFEKLSAINIQLPVYAVYVWKNTGFLMVLLVAALVMIPREVFEAAEMDGARGVKKFFSITLPLLMPALFFCTGLAVVYNLRVFREAFLLYGAYPDTSLYLMQHYMNNHFVKLNYQNLSAGAMMFSALVFLFVFGMYRLDKRMDIGI